MLKNEPPDKYKCIKVPLKKILKDENAINTIVDAVERTNKIVIKTYLLLRLWLLDHYHSDGIIPIITTDTISLCIRTLKIKIKKPKDNQTELFNEFNSLYEFEKEDAYNLNEILSYKVTTILTMIENNIKAHFFDYIKRYVISFFSDKYKTELENKTIEKSVLRKELYKVINNLLNSSNKCDDKYKSWISENKFKILPDLSSKDENEQNYFYDIKVNPQSYLSHMIWMSIEIEKFEKKAFQFFPLQNNIIPKFIPIDTTSLIDFFIIKNIKEYRENVRLHADELWSAFNITQKIKNYSFDDTIFTDGYSASLRFINNKYIQSKINKHKNMQNGKKVIKNLTILEKENVKKQKALKQLEIKKEKSKVEITCKCGSIISKATLSSHKKTLKHKKYLKDNDETDDNGYIEFPYITEVELEKLSGKHIFIDPGKRDLLTMLDDNGTRLTYSNKQYLKSTKRLKYNNHLRKYKEEHGICEIENSLSEFNSKTCDISKFKEFIDNKLRVNNLLCEKYKLEKFRRYKFYSYINKKRSEDNMLNIIETKFGTDNTIIIGDWSQGKQMRNFISTPGLRIKKKLKERFNVYNIDEYKTSCMSSKTEEKAENHYVKDWSKNKIQMRYKNKHTALTEKETLIMENKENLTRKLHSVLTFKMETNRKECINRDYNACLNMRKIFNDYISTGNRAEKYSRPKNDSNLYYNVDAE